MSEETEIRDDDVEVSCYICEFPLGWVCKEGHKLWLCSACSKRNGGKDQVTAIDVERVEGKQEPVE